MFSEIDDRIERKLDAILRTQQVVLRAIVRGLQLDEAMLLQEKHMNTDVQDLLNKVAAEDTVIGSVEALLVDLKARIDNGLDTGDLDSIRQVSLDIGNKTAEMSAAVVTNTPADPPPPPTGDAAAKAS